MGQPEAEKLAESAVDSTAVAAEAPKANAPAPMVASQATEPDDVVPTAPKSDLPETAPAERPAAVNPKLDEQLPPSSGSTWPELTTDHPLAKFIEVLPEIIKTTGYDEIYGIILRPKGEDTKGSGDFHTLLILQKFLRANGNELEPAKEQLSKTLVWRKEFRPDTAMAETFIKENFGGLGYVTVKDKKDAVPAVVTWNIYGAVKDYEKTFVPIDDFLRWRLSLMEFGVSKLNLSSASEPIPDFGKGSDPYQGIQVHDYKSVSFLRMDPRAKAASKQTIQMLGDYYPETLSRKFFVNVPIFMQWMFAAMKLFVSAETTKKFSVLSDGLYVSGELGESVPKEYGGKLGPLAEVGEELKLA